MSKYLMVEYPDGSDLSKAAIDSPASVVIGATTITGGKITGSLLWSNPTPLTLTPHTYPITGGSVTIPTLAP